MKILAISDIHGDTGHIAASADLIRGADMIVIAGDITRRGSRAEAEDIIARIEEHNRNILAVHGNWDRMEVAEFLAEKGYGLHGTGRSVGGIGFIGAGGSTPTPIHTPSEYSEQEMAGLVRAGLASVSGAAKKVLVSHTPPHGARDRTFLGIRVGSAALAEFLGTGSIALCICGHIHEAAGIQNLGATLVVNPGSFKRGKYITISLGDSIDAERGRVRT